MEKKYHANEKLGEPRFLSHFRAKPRPGFHRMLTLKKPNGDGSQLFTPEYHQPLKPREGLQKPEANTPQSTQYSHIYALGTVIKDVVSARTAVQRTGSRG